MLFGGADTRVQEAILHHISNPVRSTIKIMPIFFMLSAGAWLHRPTNRTSPFWLLLSVVSLLIGGMGGSMLIRLRQLLSFIPAAEHVVAPGFGLTNRGLVSSWVIHVYQGWSIGLIGGAGIILLCCILKIWLPATPSNPTRSTSLIDSWDNLMPRASRSFDD
ncbi:hypothetical protein [Herpetosiphon sp. NSE202]|uniref:hypothetical protein n=1 Tax=Herpetosiphon sp. NSE202 TaxID=3351349 RepID=UPI00363ADFBD